MSKPCKVVTVCGRKRRLCWGANSKIRTNTAASGGGGGHRKATHSKPRKRSKGRVMVMAWGHTAPHARKPCQRANGTLKKGWRYSKRGGRCVAAKG